MGSLGNYLSKIISVVIIGLLVWFILAKLLPSTVDAFKKFKAQRKEKKLNKSQKVEEVEKNPTNLEKKED